MDTKEKKKNKQTKKKTNKQTNKNKKNKRKMKCMQGYLNRSRRWWEVSATGSRWIEVAIEYPESFSTNQSSYREVVDNAIKNNWRVSIDSNLLKAIEKLSRWAKTVFHRREKHRYKCNQAYYLTKDPINILSSQKHLSTRKMLSTRSEERRVGKECGD